MKAEAVLLHVITELVYSSAIVHGPIIGYPEYIDPEWLKENGFQKLKKDSLDLLEQSKRQLNDHTIKTEVAEGNASQNILRVAQEISADIIVMGSHSKRWLEKILVGSVAEDVLRKSTIPLFIIPIKEE